jgi:peptidoglycan/xylan/chitin deacetylase (PgdA/CDA1 family)
MRRHLARWLYTTAVWTRWPEHRRRTDGAPVFCFHNVVEDELAGRVGDGALHMGRSAFERHATWIARTYSVIPLPELIDRLRTGRSVRGVAAITLDDAYQGTLVHGVPLLRAQALPATIFVVPRSAESRGFFWWDQFGGRLTDEVRERCLGSLDGDADLIVRELKADAAEMLPDDCRPAGWMALREAARDGLFTIGAHSLSHRHLTVLPPAELHRELVEGNEAIRQQIGVGPLLFAYPYGLADHRTVGEVTAAGYRGAVTLARALARSGQHPFALPRINVPAGISAGALQSWAAEIWFRPPPIRMPPDGSPGAVASA